VPVNSGMFRDVTQCYRRFESTALLIKFGNNLTLDKAVGLRGHGFGCSSIKLDV
jgi:hypothetical protein